MKKLILSTAFCVFPVIGMADTMERFEAISNEINGLMAEMMAKEIDQQGGDGDILRAAVPEQLWDNEMAEASECLLEKYEDELGSDGVDEMLDNMEAAMPMMADMTMTEFSDSDFADAMSPPGLDEDAVFEISQACGLMAIQVKRMRESGFMDAMMAAGATIPNNN